MKIVQGTSRVVFIGDELVAKTPRLKDARAPKYFIQRLLERGCSKKTLGFAIDLLRLESTVGITANRAEAQLFNDFPHLVVPIRFHLGRLGLINVQDKAEPFDLEYRTRHSIFTDELDRNVALIGHTIEGDDNFGIHDGRIKIVDGGGEGMTKVLHANRAGVERALRRMEEESGIG